MSKPMERTASDRPTAENKTERFRGAIHKLRTRLSCSALDTASASSSSSSASSISPSYHSPPPSPISPISPTSPLTPYEWFSSSSSTSTSTSTTTSSTSPSLPSPSPYYTRAIGPTHLTLSPRALSTPSFPFACPLTPTSSSTSLSLYPSSQTLPPDAYALSTPCLPISHDGEEVDADVEAEMGEGPYRIAMEIQRGRGEGVWGEGFTFWSTNVVELESTAGRIREFKEGRW